jgi:hypothetical protein
VLIDDDSVANRGVCCLMIVVEEMHDHDHEQRLVLSCVSLKVVGLCKCG